MHVKGWCLDAEVYIGGSYNFTHNAEVSSEEHMIVLKDPSVVETYKQWFTGLWNKATPIGQGEVDRREPA